MTWKANDPVSLRVRLSSIADLGASFASLAAAQAAGWTFIWYKDAALLSPQPTPTLIPAVSGVVGDHDLTHNLAAGVVRLEVRHPIHRPVPDCYTMVVGTADDSSLAATLSGSLGTLVSADRATQYDWDIVESDSWVRTMTFPSAALADFGYTDLSDQSGQAWSVQAYGRKPTNPPPSAKDFEIPATITDKVLRQVKLMIPAGLVGATITYANGNTQAIEYDVQATLLVAKAITAVNTGSKQFTVAGDQRLFFTALKTFTVDTGANAGTYTPTGTTAVVFNGTNTVITVAETIPSAVVAGNCMGYLRITGIKGVLTITQQETDA